MFEAVRTYLGYGMATLIYNNLLNLILGTVMFLIIIYILLYIIYIYYIYDRIFNLKKRIYRFDRQKQISDSDCTAKNT